MRGRGVKGNQFITGHYSNSKNLRNKYKSINKKGKQTGDAGYAAAFSASITSRLWGVITCSSLFIKHSVWYFVNRNSLFMCGISLFIFGIRYGAPFVYPNLCNVFWIFNEIVILIYKKTRAKFFEYLLHHNLCNVFLVNVYLRNTFLLF